MLKYSLHRLPNKIRTILAPLHETEAVTVLVLVKVGSRYEAEKVNGISHFIEHLLFKGTTKRPTSLDITKELDGVGAEYNAFTGKDHTGYYIKVNHQQLELAVDIVSDMLFNSTFAAAEIEKERGVIIEEINMYEDNPMILIDSLFEEAVFKGHPLGRTISGRKKNVQQISRPEILDYFSQYYFGRNLLIGLAGKFNSVPAKKLVEKYFNRRFTKKPTVPFKKFSRRQTKPELILKNKETEQVHLALGYPAYKLADPKNYPLLLLSVILGGNMSSRLFMEIREKLGLAYFIRTNVNAYEDTGNLSVLAGLDKTKIELALKVIISELKKTIIEKVSVAELNRAKEYVKGKLILKLEDCANIIEWLAGQLLLRGKIENLNEQIKKINRVTVGQIQQVAREIIQARKVNLTIIGPYQSQGKFLNILKNH